MGVLIGLFAVNVIVMVAKFLDIGKWGNISTLVPGFFCFAIAVAIYVGIKKIDKELKNRENE